MRPLRLTIQAFGPFQGKETIEFNALGSNSLFLINGPTGSGKTSILDAICFALYGKTTGNEREGEQMRCDQSPPDLLTELCLDFELKGHHYRIQRSPRQERPKARGEGMTLKAPEVQLWRVLDQGNEERESTELITSGKISEADNQIRLLTGLNVEQFRQVMVLPQGKFRELLLADSQDREKIFSQLFQTQIYKRLEDSLKEQSAKVRRLLEDQQQIEKGLLEGAEQGSKEELEANILALEPQHQAAQTLQQECALAQAKAQEHKQEGEALAKRFAALEQNKQNLLTLEKGAAEHQQDQRRLSQARLASRLQSPFDTRTQADAAYQSASQALNEATAQLTKVEAELAAFEARLDVIAEQELRLDSLKIRLAELDALQPRLQRLHSIGLEEQQQSLVVTQANTQVEALGLKLNSVLTQVAALEQGTQQTQQSLQAMGNLALNVSHLVQLEVLKRQQLDLEGGCATLLSQRQSAETKGRSLRQQSEESEQQLKFLEHAWHSGQAAILARELRLGEACGVCGSLEHPNPARSDAALPTQVQIESAKAQHQQLTQNLSLAREEYKTLDARLSEQQKQLQACLSAIHALDPQAPAGLEEVCSGLQAARRDLAQLEQTQSHLTQQQQALQTLRVSEAPLRADLQNQQGEEQKALQHKAALVAQRQQLEQELPKEFIGEGKLAQAITALNSEHADKLKTVTEFKQQHSASKTQRDAALASLKVRQEQSAQQSKNANDAQAAFVQALEDSSFENEALWQQALLQTAEEQTLEQGIQAYTRNFTEASARIKDGQTELKDAVQPDIQALDLTLSQATDRQQQANEAFKAQDHRFKVLLSTQDKLKALKAECTKLDEEYALVGTLSDMCSGKNEQKLSLQRFILGALLDDVLIEASTRLQLMSKGRYSLLRKIDKTKGNKASGLDLEVEDAYTGKVRAVATLSGGESFMAALALALGLSDVVQAYAGGIHLDTLFIDEGFGSLDPESLELALRTLVDLQKSGRMIGIISHVSELKEQMSQRIDVLSSKEGSSLKVVCA